MNKLAFRSVDPLLLQKGKGILRHMTSHSFGTYLLQIWGVGVVGIVVTPHCTKLLRNSIASDALQRGRPLIGERIAYAAAAGGKIATDTSGVPSHLRPVIIIIEDGQSWSGNQRFESNTLVSL